MFFAGPLLGFIGGAGFVIMVTKGPFVLRTRFYLSKTKITREQEEGPAQETRACSFDKIVVVCEPGHRTQEARWLPYIHNYDLMVQMDICIRWWCFVRAILKAATFPRSFVNKFNNVPVMIAWTRRTLTNTAVVLVKLHSN